jgi:hypothetical protein
MYNKMMSYHSVVRAILVATSITITQKTYAAGISINPGIPGVTEATDLVGIVVNIFQTALLVGAFLAFGSIVYGGITYALSESGFMKSEAKDRIIDALIGLTLLVGAYMLLYVINPALTILKNPGLEKIAIVVEGDAGSQSECTGVPNGGCVFKPDTAKPNCQNAQQTTGKNTTECATSPTPTECYTKITCNNPTQGCSGKATCGTSPQGQSACTESKSVKNALIALQANDPEIWNRKGQVTTTGGEHSKCSCHFGGTSCTDGGHAIDFGFGASVIKDNDPERIEAAIRKNGISAVCGCEDGFDDVNCSQADHVHCNIDAASCNCSSNFGK